MIPNISTATQFTYFSDPVHNRGIFDMYIQNFDKPVSYNG